MVFAVEILLFYVQEMLFWFCLCKLFYFIHVYTYTDIHI